MCHTNNPVPVGANHHTPSPDLVAMASYELSTSFYPCPLRASDIFKPQPTPPPVYYLKDHVRVEYNDSDWPTTPEGEEEASKEEGINASNRVTTAGNASMVVRAQPLGLLSAKMREYREKEKFGSNGSENGDISKEGQFASPGMISFPFPPILLTLVAEQFAPAAKADVPQASDLKYNKVLTESNVKPRAREPRATANANANANANARKKSKAASKPSRHRVQVVLTHAVEEKENIPRVSSNSDDEIDDPLQSTHAQPAKRNPSKGQEQEREQEHLFKHIDNLPDPFVLTSDDECDDPLEGGQSETKAATVGEPDTVEGSTMTDSGPARIITADPADVGDAWTPKSCLRAVNAPSKGRTVSFKDPLLKFHFYYYPDPNDIWSQCGLSMRPTRKSFTIVPPNLTPLTRNP